VKPRWVQGDSRKVLDGKDVPREVDFVFTCPPYADLEVYSDDPADISGMSYADFLSAYRDIIAKSVVRLRKNRFAAIVVGDVRAPDGTYRNFVSDTIAAFLDAGMSLYNEAILVTAVGSLAIRAGRQFQAGRKLGKTHQNVLVFVKGDPKTAVEAVGPIDFGEVEGATEDVLE
jgi:DNA modification methylase